MVSTALSGTQNLLGIDASQLTRVTPQLSRAPIDASAPVNYSYTSASVDPGDASAPADLCDAFATADPPGETSVLANHSDASALAELSDASSPADPGETFDFDDSSDCVSEFGDGKYSVDHRWVVNPGFHAVRKCSTLHMIHSSSCGLAAIICCSCLPCLGTPLLGLVTAAGAIEALACPRPPSGFFVEALGTLFVLTDFAAPCGLAAIISVHVFLVWALHY